MALPIIRSGTSLSRQYDAVSLSFPVTFEYRNWRRRILCIACIICTSTSKRTPNSARVRICNGANNCCCWCRCVSWLLLALSLYHIIIGILLPSIHGIMAWRFELMLNQCGSGVLVCCCFRILCIKCFRNCFHSIQIQSETWS